MEPIRELGSNIANIPTEEVRSLQFRDFKAALDNVKPSVSKDSLKMYEQWNKEYGGK